MEILFDQLDSYLSSEIVGFYQQYLPHQDVYICYGVIVKVSGKRQSIQVEYYDKDGNKQITSFKQNVALKPNQSSEPLYYYSCTNQHNTISPLYFDLDLLERDAENYLQVEKRCFEEQLAYYQETLTKDISNRYLSATVPYSSDFRTERFPVHIQAICDDIRASCTPKIIKCEKRYLERKQTLV